MIQEQVNPFGFPAEVTYETLEPISNYLETAYQTYCECVDIFNVSQDSNSVVNRLSKYFETGPIAYEVLFSSASAAINNLTHLHNLIYERIKDSQKNVPIETIASISRVVLISTSRLLYVLLPPTFEQKAEHLQKVLGANFDSEDRYLQKAKDFKSIVNFKEQPKPPSENPGVKISDTQMIHKAMEYVIKHISGLNGWEDDNGTSQEKMTWMWNSWSGLAHGLFWPLQRPNSTGYVSSEVMPGNYPKDFELLTTLVWKAMEELRNACKHPTSTQQEAI